MRIFAAAAILLLALAIARGETNSAEDNSIATLTGHTKWVTGVAYSPDSARLATTSDDQTVRLWDAATGKELPRPAQQPADYSAVIFSRDGKRLFTGTWHGQVCQYNLTAGTQRAFRAHAEKINSLAISPDGLKLVTGSDDDTLKLWEIAKLADAAPKPLHTFSLGNEYDVMSVAFSPDGKQIASGDGDNNLVLWEVASGDEQQTLRKHDETITAVEFSPDGNRMLSGSWDDTLIVWDAVGGEDIFALRGHTDDVNCAAYTSDGKRIVSGSADGTLIVWDAKSGKQITVLRGLPAAVTSLAISPDCRHVAAASKGVVKVWRLP